MKLRHNNHIQLRHVKYTHVQVHTHAAMETVFKNNKKDEREINILREESRWPEISKTRSEQSSVSKRRRRLWRQSKQGHSK